MPWNGSGVFGRTNGHQNGATLWAAAKAAGRKIRTDDHDTHDEDIANVLENCITRNGENSPTANLPMNAKKHTNVADGSDRSDYASYGQLLDRAGAYVAPGGVGGTGNAITLAPSPSYSSYAQGMLLRFAVKTANTGAVTVNVNGLGVKNVVKVGNEALDSGDFAVGNVVWLQYDGTRFWAAGTSAPSLGTAAARNVGVNLNQVPTLGNQGKLADSTIPDNIPKFWEGTQTEYDAIVTKDARTIYAITS